MADLTCTAQSPFVFLVSGEVNDAMEIVADLRPSAMAAAGGALLASENLADLDDAPTALTNLGGTATGVAVFAATDAAAAYTALGLGDYADDAAAATGGVAVGFAYHTAGALRTRMA